MWILFVQYLTVILTLGSVSDVDLASESGFVRGLPGIPDTVDGGKKILNTFLKYLIFLIF